MSTGRRLGYVARNNWSLGALAEVGALYDTVFGGKDMRQKTKRV
jgi:hypothetical protein